jgi:hypothetical protein
MTRDFSRDLTILVAGSGNITMQALEESLGDWIFPDPDAEREVHVILPLFADMGGAVRNLIKLGTEWEFNFNIVHTDNAPMTREISAMSGDNFKHAQTEHETLELALGMLTDAHKAGHETALVMAYNPKSVYEQGNPSLSDLEILGDAKNYQWLQTLNLCESLVDSFEGFMTTDERLKAERLQKEFEDKQRAEEAAKPAPAKKAAAPRKRAAKKVEPQESKPLAVEAEKPLENPCEDIPALELDPQREDSRNALSANVPVVMGPTPDIQEDINAAHAQVEKRNMIAVSKIDLAQLSTDIKGLTEAFGNIMDTFTRILKDG